MSTSRARVEDTYESQNDQRLDELHTKIRTLRGVTTDIHDDVERQNLMLDETGDRFTAFGNALTQTSDRAARAFGIGEGGLKTFRIAMLVVALFITFWISSKLYHWWWPAGTGTA
ncbi:hypothetical protein LshimejAT787_0900900 [Lyophyllum shimeji]|uniref:t-SNARE coiled-coil homology domain-containing protein n=1 Tax=Lyophyllum shimeji TaxID=47721 RepID=A0A9P3PQL8_LYOSH|nr:hypothetical protein LshimejAT787_0900900 [Lyophyllum shimeji]